jgi:opacity protein-like surface antigen
MRNHLALGLVALAIVFGSSCTFIPPYSSIKEQSVSGFQTVKFRSGVYSSIDLEADDIVNTPPTLSTSEELDRFSSFGVELERLIGNQFSATVSLDAREYHSQSGGAPIRGNQVHAGLRRYFGDRALTAFLAGQLIYNFGLEFQESGYESDGFLAWGVGAGLNMAMNENFSIEAAFMYEGMPDVASHLKGNNATSSGFEHNLSGMIGYVAIGYHF